MDNYDIGFSSIGKRIRSYRKRTDMTQAGLAEKAGMDTNNISRIERGVATPNLESMLKICIALGVTPNDLLLESYDAPQKELDTEIASMLEGLSSNDYRKVLEYIRFIKGSR